MGKRHMLAIKSSGVPRATRQGKAKPPPPTKPPVGDAEDSNENNDEDNNNQNNDSKVGIGGKGKGKPRPRAGRRIRSPIWTAFHLLKGLAEPGLQNLPYGDEGFRHAAGYPSDQGPLDPDYRLPDGKPLTEAERATIREFELETDLMPALFTLGKVSQQRAGASMYNAILGKIYNQPLRALVIQSIEEAEGLYGQIQVWNEEHDKVEPNGQLKPTARQKKNKPPRPSNLWPPIYSLAGRN